MPSEPRRPELQPDQVPRLWNDYVAEYEQVFEPLTNRFAAAALDALDPAPGVRLLDVGAGAGGAALLAAERGARVTAVDAAFAMTARIAERSGGRDVAAVVADAAALPFADRRFDAAISVFGVILCPDPVGALREIGRALGPGGRVAVVTWREPERYELATRLMAASAAIRGAAPPAVGGRPAQLRFTAEEDFRAIFVTAGLEALSLDRVEARLEAPSAAWLGARLGFAPGLASMLDGQGAARDAVVARFVEELERDQGAGAVTLGAVASVALARARGPKDRLQSA